MGNLPYSKNIAKILVICVLLAFPAQAADVSSLTIRTQEAAIALQVELATTAEQLRTGLMYRKKLAPDAGMLFDYAAPRRIYMWMKNTYIPLDMFFTDSGGRIIYIAHNTTPLSEETITAPIPARAVLEVNAGFAKKYNIAIGDKIEHAIFAR